jgi:hypothetical protein
VNCMLFNGIFFGFKEKIRDFLCWYGLIGSLVSRKSDFLWDFQVQNRGILEFLLGVFGVN